MNKFSDDYYKLIKEYQDFHKNGINKIAPHKTFTGSSLSKWVDEIKMIKKRNDISSIIDFGCGKAYLYKERFKIITKEKRISYDGIGAYWNVNDIVLYDPGVEEYSVYPNQQKDMVICTDVLEHISPQDTEKFIRDIFLLANKLVFFVIHIKPSPSNKKLSNGENIHINLKTIEEWKLIFSEFQNEFSNIKIIVKFGDF